LQTIFERILGKDRMRADPGQAEPHQKRAGYRQIYFPSYFHGLDFDKVRNNL
jgi:hypothetical protein